MEGDVTLYRWLADITVILHAAFVLFVVGGQLLILAGWVCRWIWTQYLVFRVVHLIAIVFVMLEAWFGITCPLTTLEYSLRKQAGQAISELSFIGYWLDRLLFYQAPSWVFTLIYTVFASIVLVTLIAYPPRMSHSK